MGELEKILLTAVVTTFGAIIVFVVTQPFGKLVVETIQDFRKVLGEIRYALVFHAQAIFTPVGDTESENEASKALRRLSCELRSKLESVPLYETWSGFARRFLPPSDDVFEGC
jgi:hypothetical protein